MPKQCQTKIDAVRDLLHTLSCETRNTETEWAIETGLSALSRMEGCFDLDETFYRILKTILKELKELGKPALSVLTIFNKYFH